MPHQPPREIANEAANSDWMASPDSASPGTAYRAYPAYPAYLAYPAYRGVFLACRGAEFPAVPECSAYRGCWERPESLVYPAGCLPGSFARTHSWLQ